MDSVVLVVAGVGVALALVGCVGFLLTQSDDDSRASGVFAFVLVAVAVLAVLTPIVIVVAMHPTGPVEIVLAASALTAAAEMALDRPSEEHTPRARLFDLLGWLVFVCWAGVVLWQVRRVIASDAEVDDKINFVAPMIGVVMAIPMYSLVVLPLQRLMNLGEGGERILRLVVALLFGLAVQEVAWRLDLQS